MYAVLIIFHLLAAAILILVVLLQSGKAGDLASTFGGATSQTAFGARGAATMLTKVTTACAVTFMLTSLGLSLLSSRGDVATVMDSLDTSETVTQEAPAEEVAVPEAAAPETAPAESETEPQPENNE
jgi:preprotein translocase subunit SecG